MEEATISDGGDAPVTTADARHAAGLLAWVDRRRWWLFGAIAVLYLAGFNGQWRVSPDSALYASLGRSLAEGQGYSYQGERHTWVEPGLPYIISFGFRLAGPDAFWPTLLVLLASAFAALALFYRLMLVHADRPTAVVMTTLLALNETFYRYPLHLFTDTPFLVGVLLFLLGYEFVIQGRERQGLGRWSPWLYMALGTLIMVSMRPAVWTFLGALFATVAWYVVRGPNRLRTRHLAIAVLAVACVLAFRAIDPRLHTVADSSVVEGQISELVLHRTGFMIRRTLTEMVPMMFEETAPEAIYGSRLGPGISTLVTVATIGLGIGLMRRRPLWGLLVGATFAQMLIHLPRERYFLPVLPLLLYALWRAAVWLDARLRPPWSAVGFGLVVILMLVPNVGIIVGDIIQQHRSPFLEHYDRGQYARLKELAVQVQREVGERDVIIAEQDRALSYFSRRRCVPPLTARRWPATEAEWEAYRTRLASADNLFVVLPGKHVEELAKQLPMEIDSRSIATAGKWSLHRAKLASTSKTQ
jgi:hypothetical protein